MRIHLVLWNTIISFDYAVLLRCFSKPIHLITFQGWLYCSHPPSDSKCNELAFVRVLWDYGIQLIWKFYEESMEVRLYKFIGNFRLFEALANNCTRNRRKKWAKVISCTVLERHQDSYTTQKNVTVSSLSFLVFFFSQGTVSLTKQVAQHRLTSPGKPTRGIGSLFFFCSFKRFFSSSARSKFCMSWAGSPMLSTGRKDKSLLSFRESRGNTVTYMLKLEEAVVLFPAHGISRIHLHISAVLLLKFHWQTLSLISKLFPPQISIRRETRTNVKALSFNHPFQGRNLHP